MIRFLTDNVEMPVFDQQAVRRWITSVAADYSKRVGDINYVFCNDERILQVNREFLAHDYYTDIITFDYSVFPVIAGDIFISLDTVATNAIELGIDFKDELNRIIIHGVLHLTGQGDKTPETRLEMTRKENLALAKLT